MEAKQLRRYRIKAGMIPLFSARHFLPTCQKVFLDFPNYLWYLFVYAAMQTAKQTSRKDRKAMSIIKDIYYGAIEMQDSACASEQYRTELKALVAADNALREALTPEQVRLLDTAKECNNRLNDTANAEIFEQGFRLGALLMLEIVYGTTEE